MEDSILLHIRKALTSNEQDDSFDTELMLYINGCMAILEDTGVNPVALVTDTSQEWSQIGSLNGTSDASNFLGLIKLYVTLRVRLLFDPPSASATGYLEKSIDETYWRIHELVNPPYFDIESDLISP